MSNGVSGHRLHRAASDGASGRCAAAVRSASQPGEDGDPRRYARHEEVTRVDGKARRPFWRREGGVGWSCVLVGVGLLVYQDLILSSLALCVLRLTTCVSRAKSRSRETPTPSRGLQGCSSTWLRWGGDPGWLRWLLGRNLGKEQRPLHREVNV